MADLRCSVTRIKFDMQQRSALHAGPALQSTVTRPKDSNATTKQGNIGHGSAGAKAGQGSLQKQGMRSSIAEQEGPLHSKRAGHVQGQDQCKGVAEQARGQGRCRTHGKGRAAYRNLQQNEREGVSKCHISQSVQDIPDLVGHWGLGGSGQGTIV